MTDTNTNETQITVPDDVPAIHIVREFDAPPSKVFRAHMDPDLFVQWVGPDSLDEPKVDVWDARTGGARTLA